MKLFRDIQDAICDGIDETFREDLWERDGGGGGRTRVVEDGAFLEKGGVNYSEVHGEFSEEFAEKVPGSGRAFYATGVSLVLHPVNPHVPTVHANFRHIRHTAITAASNDPTVPDRHVDLLAGHSTGIKEHYVVPEAVRMACEAIERHYVTAIKTGDRLRSVG